MISWIKRNFGIKEKSDVSPLQDLELAAKYERLLRDHKRLLEKANADSLLYTTIKTFDVRDREFVRKMSVIYDSEEMTFMLYDLRQQCVEKMVEGAVEVNIQMTGVIKGIDCVIKNLAGYDDVWKTIVEQEKYNAAI